MFYYCVNSKNEGGLIKMAVKIMIADDHSMIREGLKSLLELEGDIQVVAEAEDGVDCLEKLKICTPDVLLLDINMPRKNGLEVLQTLKSSKSKVKVLVLTVHNEVEYLMKAVDIGVDGYILKDSESAELKKAIFSIVEGENYIQPSLIPSLNSKMIEKNRDEGKIESLTKRELEVLKLLAVGMYNKEVAEKLNMSDKSVSKWERGICLSDVSVYLELCKILDISINEFLAGEDIPKETIEQKAEENIIQITKDNKNKQNYLKKIIRLLIVMLVVFIFITSIFIYKKLTQPQNYIEPYLEKSTEMQTANMLSSHPGNILLFHYNSKKNYDSLTMYLTQYQKGKKISDKEICTFYNNPSKGTNTGNIALVVDYEASTLKIIDAFEDGYYVAEGISFLENISNYDVWDYDKIEEKTSIKYSKKQMLVALSYGKNHVTSLPIKGLETNKKIKNDYTCILSIKFK